MLDRTLERELASATGSAASKNSRATSPRTKPSRVREKPGRAGRGRAKMRPASETARFSE
jgi:hypothetical protein